MAIIYFIYNKLNIIIGVLPVVKDNPQLPSLIINEDNEESVPPPLPPKSYDFD